MGERKGGLRTTVGSQRACLTPTVGDVSGSVSRELGILRWCSSRGGPVQDGRRDVANSVSPDTLAGLKVQAWGKGGSVSLKSLGEKRRPREERVHPLGFPHLALSVSATWKEIL